MSTLGVAYAALILAFLLQPIATAAVLRVIMEEYVGRRPSIGEAFAFALTRFLPLLGTSFLVGLLVTVGLFLCIAPGVHFAVSYIFVAQVVVLEKLSGGEAMSRAQKLISGHRGRVFGILLLVGLASFAIQIGVGLGLGFVLPSQTLVQTERGLRVEFNALNHVVDTLVAQLVGIVFSTYGVVCTTLLYLDTRIRKEGLDLELAAQLGEEPDADGPQGRRVDREDDDDDGWAGSGDRPSRRRESEDDLR